MAPTVLLVADFSFDSPLKVAGGVHQVSLISLDGVKTAEKRIFSFRGVPDSPALLFPGFLGRIGNELDGSDESKVTRGDVHRQVLENLIWLPVRGVNFQVNRIPAPLQFDRLFAEDVLSEQSGPSGKPHEECEPKKE